MKNWVFVKALSGQFMNGKYSDVIGGIPWLADSGEINEHFALSKASCCETIEYESSEGACCIFVNGFYRSDLSRLPKGVEVVSLKQARSSYSPLFKVDASAFPTTPFIALHSDSYDGGVFIYVYKSNSVIDIEILNYVSDESSVVLPRLYIVIGVGCEVIFTFRTVESCIGHVNGKVECFVETGGKCRFEFIPGSRTGEEIWTVFSLLKSKSHQDCRIVHNEETEGLKFYDCQTFLSDKESQGNFSLKGELKGKSRLFANVRMEHQAEDTISNQNIRTILDDESAIVFQGEIYIHAAAQNSSAGQQHDSLVLSNDAVVETNPSLDIFADQVKASHGATLGRPDETAVFYLRSRGIAVPEVTQLLKRAFLEGGNENSWN